MNPLTLRQDGVAELRAASARPMVGNPSRVVAGVIFAMLPNVRDGYLWNVVAKVTADGERVDIADSSYVHASALHEARAMRPSTSDQAIPTSAPLILPDHVPVAWRSAEYRPTVVREPSLGKQERVGIEDALLVSVARSVESHCDAVAQPCVRAAQFVDLVGRWRHERIGRSVAPVRAPVHLARAYDLNGVGEQPIR